MPTNVLINPNNLEVVEAINHFGSKQWPTPNQWRTAIAVCMNEYKALRVTLHGPEHEPFQ